jgi:capsular polysaccharide biosynthesis protein
MPKDCPECCQALEELVQELRKMATKDQLVSKVAAKMEVELQVAIAAAKKDPQDLKLILTKLNGAQTFIEGVASASGLQNHFAQTITFVKSHLP